MVVVVAGLMSLILTGTFIQVAQRAGWGKSIRAAGPESHLSKGGTPTMGGVAFLLAAIVAWAIFAEDHGASLASLLLIVGSGLLGLLDDILSLQLKRRRSEGEDAGPGLMARYRLIGQGVISLAYAIWAVQNGASLFGFAYLDVAAHTVVIVGAINALNFTDGLDGLAASVAAIILIFFIASPLAAALLGALLGFLWYNAHPARLFMGGVGSEALGAAVAAFAIQQGTVWYLPLIALVPVLEVLSVMAQVTYFRLSGGKRLLRMSPLHHHFELSGWAESKIVARASLITAAALALAVTLRGSGL